MLTLLAAATIQGTVVFAEDFESPTTARVAERWSNASNLEGMSLVQDSPPGSPGRQSIRMTSELGKNTGGHLYVQLPQGYEKLYARFYVKFAPDCRPVHHFVHMGGYNPPTPWPQGGAGTRPNGNERFTVGIEPMGERWQWDAYAYWMRMRGNPGDGVWGNTFNPSPRVPVRRGEWICVEMMIKLNDVDYSPADRQTGILANGELSFWIDGKPAHSLGPGFPRGSWKWDKFLPDEGGEPFEGFQWRSDPALKINFFWLLFYTTKGSPGQRDWVQFDDVVVSTTPIGPH